MNIKNNRLNILDYILIYRVFVCKDLLIFFTNALPNLLGKFSCFIYFPSFYTELTASLSLQAIKPVSFAKSLIDVIK